MLKNNLKRNVLKMTIQKFNKASFILNLNKNSESKSTNIKTINNLSKYKNLKSAIDNEMQMKQLIFDTIKTNGPISLETYMEMCLYDSNFGYYTTKEHIFGSQGDFITGPEVSSMFGNSISVFIYKILESWGFPKKYDIVEIGAGRGILARDILKGLINVNAAEGCRLNIIEKSQKLIKIQQETVNGMLLKKKIFTEYNYDEVIL